ncbi:Nucleolar protein 6 [Portunus trituberculatus]|uniref:Nucleolar protein 6 n=1 Tax=Portunus trituberculatus TaxID=210409 RepID=A0A5B7DWD9_PORTR|nr:Nucleolar protein 6 [Portunus trituberculatus]
MEELNMLRETQMLYHSNLFRMQMEELLAEVSLKEKRRQQFSQWLTKLSAHLTSLPEFNPIELSDKPKLARKGIHDPLLETLPKITGNIIFAAPTKLEVVGSFASGTVTTLNPTIDVMMILPRGMGSFSGHMVTLFVIHLLQSRKINSQMSPYQVFRNALLSIGSVDWTVKGVNMCPTPDNTPSLDVLHQLYEVVFVDPSGLLNLAAMMITADFQRIQHESQLAIAFLNSSAADSFESLFIKKTEMFQMSDQFLLVRVKKKEGMQTLSKKKSNHLQHTLNWLGDARQVLWSCMLAVLSEGLLERKILIAPRREASRVWQVDQPPPQRSWSLEVGLILDPASAWALLTKDGSFHEAVLWGNPNLSQAQRRLIPERICKDVLYRHCGVNEENVTYIAKQTEMILHCPEYEMAFEYATGEEATQQAIQAFDSLSRKLRSLDLPLKITAVQPKSDVNRHSRVFPPLAVAVPSAGKAVKVAENQRLFSGREGTSGVFRYAMKVIIFLEISGKWPDDLDAIQAIKAEFHSKMCDLLSQDNITAVVSPNFLQILWMGYFFRVQVCYLREIYLQRLVETPEGDWKEQETAAATQLELDIETLPRLTTAIARLAL